MPFKTVILAESRLNVSQMNDFPKKKIPGSQQYQNLQS